MNNNNEGKRSKGSMRRCLLVLALNIWLTPLMGADHIDDRDAEVSRRTGWIMGAYAAGMAYYGYNAWWKENSGDFRVVREGWFGHNTYRGGADKFGHMYTTYVSTRLLAQALEAVGNPVSEAQWKAAALTGATTFAVEVLDGYTREIGFSFEDLVLDAAGIGLGLFMERHPWWDGRFDFRVHYWPSHDARRLNERDPVDDYSGQTYLFVAKLNGFDRTRNNRVLRYVELSLGYGARGYKPTDGTQEQTRRIFAGISLNLSQLLNDTIFQLGRYKTAKTISGGVLEYIQVPAVTGLKGHDLD